MAMQLRWLCNSPKHLECLTPVGQQAGRWHAFWLHACHTIPGCVCRAAMHGLAGAGISWLPERQAPTHCAWWRLVVVDIRPSACMAAAAIQHGACRCGPC